MLNDALTACHAVALPGDGGQWVHLLPVGTFAGRDGRGPYRLEDATAVMAAARAYAGSADLPVDYDHALDLAAPQGRPALAAGWIKELRADARGLWGRVEWTARAVELLRDREYRYLSPVFTHTKDGRVTGLLRAALTNVPNLDLKALASAGGIMKSSETDLAGELAALLGLSDQATAGDIVAAIRELLTARQSAEIPDPAKWVPMEVFQQTVIDRNRLDRGISLQAATSAVDDQISRGLLLPFMRDWGIQLCSTNKPAFDEFVSKTSGGVQTLFKPICVGKPPSVADGPSGGLSGDELAVCRQLGHTPEEFKRATKR